MNKLVENFCSYLTKKIRKENPEVDDEKAEIIKYGLELMIGELPKLLIIVIIAFVLKIGWLVLFAYIVLLPYKVSTGGFHCKSHLGCFIGTCVMFYGTAFLSKYIIFEPLYLKYIIAFIIFTFCFFMIKLYAPADTENVPIFSIKERNKKKKLAYIFLIINLIAALFIQPTVLGNIFIFGTLIHTFTITKLAYTLSKSKYGYQK